MKDFIKWLGVNDKIAKVVVWLMIIMIMLITINAALNSLGFSHYQITYQNLKQIDSSIALDVFSSLLLCLLNFYCIVLLVFRLKEAKRIFKYAIIYTILNWLITAQISYIATQIFIVVFTLLFCYFYSNKNKKYILYGIIAFVVDTAVQGVAYLYKINYIDFDKIGSVTVSLLSIDYLIIMGIIILVKEIYLKKRSEKVCGMDQEVGYGSANSKKKTNLPKN